MQKANNLWQLLTSRADRTALMTACGVAQNLLENGSDYDRFRAYAACMPLYRGHPILTSDAALIGELLGREIPICPESCDALWHAAAYALTGIGEQPMLPEPCRIDFVAPAKIYVQPVRLGGARYAAPTAALIHTLTDAEAVTLDVQLTGFVKPNPYAAGKALAKHERGEVLTVPEQDLLAAQTLRVLGRLCADRGIELYVHATIAEAAPWRALLAYLQQSGCLAQIVLTVDDANALREAANLAGCLPNPTDAPTVRVGIANVQEREALLDLYQTLLPIGVLPPVQA